jgi:hypothetical protein
VTTYASTCAPLAVAAVARISREEAAAAIRAVARAFGDPEPTEATPHLVMIRTVMALGLNVQAWRPSGEIHRRAGRYRIEMMEPAPRATPLDELPPDVAAAVLGERQRAALRAGARTAPPPPPRLRVNEWLARFPRGLWLLCPARHVLVARAGRIVAGDPHDRYGGSVLAAADRILEIGA